MTNSKMFWKYGIVLACVLVVIVVLSLGCVQKESDETVPPTPVTDGAPSTPIEVNLSISKAPALNQTAELTCVITSILDAPDTTAQILLPKGARLVSGDLTWQGDLEADKPIAFSAKIVFEESGNWAIEAAARHVIDEENSWGDIDVIYLNVGVDHGEFGWPSVGPTSVVEQGSNIEEGAPSTPIEVNLSISKAPALNQTAELTCVITSILDAPDTTAQIILPKGARLVSGDLTWQGDLEADKPISFSTTIRFEESGNWAIEAAARHVIDEENSWGDIDVIYLNVGVDRGEFGWPSVGPTSVIEQGSNIEEGAPSYLSKISPR